MAKNDWGGKWTEHKLDAFISYVRAYLTIMKKYKFWETIYFDGFAGVGEKIKKKSDQLLIDFWDGSIPEEIDLYKGASKRVLEENQLLFDYYYFIELDDTNIKTLNKIADKATHIDRNKIQVRKDDCNNQILLLSNALKKKKHAALVFLDPFGMQINWKSIASLKETKSDIWILIPSGVAISRLLPRSGNIKSRKILESFFGLKYDEIYNFFYDEHQEETLFGTSLTTKKKDDSIEKIVSLYREQLLGIWKYATKKPLILFNSKKVPIFHLIFASNNANALKIASQIIDKRQPKN